MTNAPTSLKQLNGLDYLAGLRIDSPERKTNVIDELRASGVPATWHGDWIYVAPSFASAWEKAVRRYKNVPKGGVRLRRLIQASLKAC